MPTKILGRTSSQIQICLLAGFFLFVAIRPSDAGYEDGERAYRNDDFATAHNEWLAAADAGDARALYFLGLMYQMGKGVEKDRGKSISYIMQAAEAGEPRAQYDIGSTLALLGDTLNLTGVRKKDQGSIGFSWTMRAALKGVGPAYEALAEIYCKGIFVDKNPDLADVWYIIAYQDDPFLRAIYRNRKADPFKCGPGPDVDPIRAKHLYERSIALRKAYGLPPTKDVIPAAPDWFFR